mgnify:CR=1 FL=1
MENMAGNYLFFQEFLRALEENFKTAGCFPELVQE